MTKSHRTNGAYIILPHVVYIGPLKQSLFKSHYYFRVILASGEKLRYRIYTGRKLTAQEKKAAAEWAHTTFEFDVTKALSE